MATFRRRMGKQEVRVRRYNNKTISKTFIQKEDAHKWAGETETQIEKGFKSRGDYSIVIILIIVLVSGTLILISWISEKLLGIYGISKFVDSIFNIDFFIVYIYLILSTLTSILWWGYIILDKFPQKKIDD